MSRPRGIWRRRTAAALVLVCAASCAKPYRQLFRPWSPAAPEVLAVGASSAQIVAAVNEQTARLHSYQTRDASLKLQGMPGTPTMRADIAATRPHRFRLIASTMLTSTEVDLGSNDERFWSWVRRSEPPAVYTVRHDQYAGSEAQRLMPIEPKWLLDALGFMQLDPGLTYEGPTPIDKQRVELRALAPSATGSVHKRWVIDARSATVLEQYVYDLKGNLLASAVSRSHRYDEATRVTLPQIVEVRVPPADLALTIDVGDVAINALVQNQEMWTPPAVPGVPTVDLGAGSGGAAAPLGGQLTGADWSAPVRTPLETAAPAAGGPSPATSPLTPPSAPLPVPQTARTLPAGGVSLDPPFVR